jgi:hypothetical protein
VKLPRDIGQALSDLPEDFVGSVVIHANGAHHQWVMDVTRRVRAQAPTEWWECGPLPEDGEGSAQLDKPRFLIHNKRRS